MIPGHVQRALAADPSAHICRHTPDKGAYICASTRPDKCGYMDLPPQERLGLGSHVGSTHDTQTDPGRRSPRRQRRVHRDNHHGMAAHWPGGTSVTSEHGRRVHQMLAHVERVLTLYRPYFEAFPRRTSTASLTE